MAASLMVLGGGLPSAYAGQGGATINGDVNCSGDLDLSDAIFTLSYLFNGGEAPCPLADQAGGGQRIEELEEVVDSQAAEIAVLRAELAQVRVELVDTQASLIQSQGAVIEALQDVSVMEEELEGARRELAIAEETAQLCQGELEKVNPQLTECVAQLAETRVTLDECRGELSSSSESLVECETSLAVSEEDRATMEARLKELGVPGCTDPEADNYDCTAVIDDGTCEIRGCTNPDSPDFNPRANIDDGSCDEELDIEGFTFIERNEQGYAEYSHSATGIVFVLIPDTGPDGFLMGSPEDECGREFQLNELVQFRRGGDEGPLHQVVLSHFLIAKYELTQIEWSNVMGDIPSACGCTDRDRCRRGQFQLEELGDDNSACDRVCADPERWPVESVSWFQCRVFCERAGLELPTEAQWEYACRAGSTSPFSTGLSITTAEARFNRFRPYCTDEIRRPNNCFGDYMGIPNPVGNYPPNGFGLYDMHGNVAEWCLDRYSLNFYSLPEASDLNPVNDISGLDRIIRGGSKNDGAQYLRSAARFHLGFQAWSGGVGFRPAFTLPIVDDEEAEAEE